VEVFDVAIVDGEIVPLVQHSIARSQTGGYLLSVTFPAVERTLQYDPTISLGVLLPSATERASSGGGLSNMELMIGAGVAVPIALVLAVVVMVVGAVMMRRRRQKATALMRKKLAATEMGELSGASVGNVRYSVDEQANELWDNHTLRGH
jgi:hypothetical protein